MRTLALRLSVTVTLNGAGGGTAQTGPASPGEQWQLTTASVSCSTHVNEATCNIYLGGAVGQSTFVDGTFSGSSGDSTNNVTYPLNPGQSIFAVWANGDAGATATLVLQGTRTLP
jgi:hypothetical protein